MALTPLPTVPLSSSAAGERPRASRSWRTQGQGHPRGGTGRTEVVRLRLAQHKAPGEPELGGARLAARGPAALQTASGSPEGSQLCHRELPGPSGPCGTARTSAGN